MWRDYLGYAAVALAVVNGALAFLIAKMPVRRSVLKLRLGAFALVLAVLAIGTTIYARHQAGSEVERQQADRIDVRKRLDNFALEGRALLGQIKDSGRDMPTRAADEWAQRVEIFLRDKLGERAIARFRRDVDALYGDDATVPPARMAYWKAVRNRTVNLELIGAELAETPLRR